MIKKRHHSPCSVKGKEMLSVLQAERTNNCTVEGGVGGDRKAKRIP